MEAKDHDEDGAADGEEELFAKALKLLLLIGPRHESRHEDSWDDRKDTKDEHLHKWVSLPTTEDGAVVRELKRDQQREVEADGEINHGLSSTHDTVHQEETKDAE